MVCSNTAWHFTKNPVGNVDYDSSNNNWGIHPFRYLQNKSLLIWKVSECIMYAWEAWNDRPAVMLESSTMTWLQRPWRRSWPNCTLPGCLNIKHPQQRHKRQVSFPPVHRHHQRHIRASRKQTHSRLIYIGWASAWGFNGSFTILQEKKHFFFSQTADCWWISLPW